MSQLTFNPQQTPDDFNKNEWLETNGLGGWASSTITGCNTRRYHGLLVAAVKPPTERMVLVSKLDETLVTADQRFGLSTNDFGNAVAPQGYLYLKSFSKSLCSSFLFDAGGVQLQKSVLMLYNQNTTVIQYEVKKAHAAFTLELLPLLAMRNYHELMVAHNETDQQIIFKDGQLNVGLYAEGLNVFINVPGAQFQAKPHWYYHFNYGEEKKRGFDFSEDLFNPGTFSVALKEGDSLYVILSTENCLHKNGATLFEAEKNRKRQLLKGAVSNPAVEQLILAADQFIVKKKQDLKTVIAGYHWFTDWTRDTMISLPGLCLVTKRFDDAKKILSAFVQTADRGMLPNRFAENGEATEYNNVDGTLWYFIAAYKYLQATNDKKFVLKELLPVLKNIMDWHFKGTRYNIHAEDDGLLYAGEEGMQLTWMDVRIGEQVITPRMGKPVEVQALWYNALMIYSELLHLNKQETKAKEISAVAAKAKTNFQKKFWYADGKYLYDGIDVNGQPETALRPNQLFAISLPFTLIEGAKAKSILKVVEEKLYTPNGLRTLSPDDEHYIAHYRGGVVERDNSYHQGTVWTWLLGAYVDALFKTTAAASQQKKAAKVIQAIVAQLYEAGIGSLSEIYDAEPPFTPGGCIAQAWSVAEVLRVIVTYGLVVPPPQNDTEKRVSDKSKRISEMNV